MDNTEAGNGPGAAARPSWEPGLLHLKFREGIKPEFHVMADADAEFRSLADFDATALNQILRKHHLQEATPALSILPEEATALQTRAQQKGIELPNLSTFFTLRFPEGAEVQRIAQELNQLPEIERAAPVPRARGTQIPLPLEEPLLGSTDKVVPKDSHNLERQWYIFRCRAHEAWREAPPGTNVVIANIEQGFNTAHVDLAPNIEPAGAHNVINNNANVSVGGGIFHGTATLGFAGAAANNLGMVGFAFEASLRPIQAVEGDSKGQVINGTLADVAQGILHVLAQPTDGRRLVITLQFQTGMRRTCEQDMVLNAAIQTAIAQEAVVCVSAGNGEQDAGLDDSGNPITETGSIVVGATMYYPIDNRRAHFEDLTTGALEWGSNWGPRVVVCAPGDDDHNLTCGIGYSATGTILNNYFWNGFGGTSAATPMVAGTAAMMLAANHTIDHASIRTILNTTGGPVATEATKPVGTFLDSAAAVRQARSFGWDEQPLSAGFLKSNPVVAQNYDGRLELFAGGGSYTLQHMSQTSPGDWLSSSWSSLGGNVIDVFDPVVAQNADGRLEVFMAGASGYTVEHIWQMNPGDWSSSSWISLGGTVVGSPAVGRNADGRLEVFHRGITSNLYHKWQTAPNTGWSPGWNNLGAPQSLQLTGEPVVGQHQDGRLEVFVRASDDALWHIGQTSPNAEWSGWASLEAPFLPVTGTFVGIMPNLAVAQQGDGSIDVFVRGADDNIWFIGQTSPNGGFGGWLSLGTPPGGRVLGDPIVAQNRDGSLEVFVRGEWGLLWHAKEMTPNTNDFSRWLSLGGEGVAWDRPAVGQNADGRLEVFVPGFGQLHQRKQLTVGAW